MGPLTQRSRCILVLIGSPPVAHRAKSAVNFPGNAAVTALTVRGRENAECVVGMGRSSRWMEESGLCRGRGRRRGFTSRTWTTRRPCGWAAKRRRRPAQPHDARRRLTEIKSRNALTRRAAQCAQVVAVHAKFAGETFRLGGATGCSTIPATDKMPVRIVAEAERRRSWRPRTRTCSNPYSTIRNVSRRESIRMR